MAEHLAVRRFSGGAAARPPATALPEAVDLHADLSELFERLADAAALGDVTDAYLTACGISQLIEDWHDGTQWRARQLTAMLGTRGLVRRALRAGVDAATAVRSLSPAGHRAGQALGVASLLMTELADALCAPLVGGVAEPGGRGEAARFPPRAQQLAEALGAFDGRALPPRLRAGLVRPPSCFRSFDQHPRDVVELARRFAQVHPDRARPLAVLGVRTSGGYLAPLTGSALTALGYRGVASATARPGAPLPRAALLSALHGRGLVLVVDDPPSSGGSMAAVANAVCSLGFAAEQVVPVFAAFGSGTAPATLAEYGCVILPPTDWHIRTQLSGPALQALVHAAFPEREVVSITAPRPGLPGRGAHLAVGLTARMRDEHGVAEVELAAEGVGQGYLGRHALAVAERLPGLVPTAHLLRDGVMLREHGPETAVAAVPAEAVAAYAAARQRRLATTSDRSGALRGRQPVWEIGARVLSRGFGRLAPVLRPFLIDPALRSLLRSGRPCLVDGATAGSAWLVDGAQHAGHLKTDFDDGCFSHLDLAVYDAAYDLAGAALRMPAFERALIEGFERASGDRVDPARWCVYQLVQAWNLERGGAGTVPWPGRSDVAPRSGFVDAGRAQARAVQALFGKVFLGDLDTEPDGPWCVLDVDGVLELDLGGVPVTTLAAMRALRALRAHGYRVILATGRSIPDVRDRCAAYRLPGGVGEYGAAIYDAATGAVSGVYEPDEQACRRDGLIADLSSLPSVRCDPSYQWGVRAGVTDGSRRRGLDATALRRLAAAHPGFTQVPGDAQTDFVPAGVDKAAGVEKLISHLGGADEPVALAVGDSAADLGILRMARLGLAPAHAAPALRASGITLTRAPYQVGLAQAVGRLLGHRPGGCGTCRMPRPSRGEELVLTLLSVGQGGRRGLPAAALRLAALRASSLMGKESSARWE